MGAAHEGGPTVAVGKFLFATVDCLDPESLARFWAEVLGTEVDTAMDDGRYVFLKGAQGLPVLCFQRVPEAKSGKTRIHLDVSVTDLDAATARVLELGGSWPGTVEQRLEGFSWRTLTDPEGNEFDVAVG
jgi:predicted enzyme related to lactoylglutathione lyase